jgi:PKHD-type hydroxylase
MINHWELWPNAVPSDFCDYIINKAKAKTAMDAVIGMDPLAPPTEKHRSSTVRWLDVQGDDKDIALFIMNYVNRSNRNNFGFDITFMNEIQFTEYHGDKTGKYDWHHDVFWENTAPYDRKLSVVIQLSDPKDYYGGEFEFFGVAQPPESFKERGSLLIFPSFFMHRVKPVTWGQRNSLVTWVEGPKFR